MTEQIKSAIEELESRISPYNCCQADYLANEAIKIAIRSLKAWEEVIEELEILIRGCNIMLEDNNEDMFYGGKKRAYEKVIEVINQKLSEVEDGRS